jgi:hypothetical protein
VRRFLAAVLVFGLLAGGASGCARSGDAGAGPVSGEPGSDVPGDVYEVRTLGTWREGARAGAFRVVTLRAGFDRVQTVVIVQWMEQAMGAMAPDVVAARHVALLDDLGPVAVRAVRPTPVANGLRVSILISNLVSGEQGEVEVLAGAPGELTAAYAPASAR